MIVLHTFSMRIFWRESFERNGEENMKKSITAALTTTLVIGAASTTFAAANPFSDVPSDHWAYDAVTTLANDGVIEGYGDTTFQGSQKITRYEMAQMIAKAMAKKDVSAADKALIEKLAAEFSDELNNLGVRVAKLEKNADKVKWGGMLRYDYGSVRYDKAPVDIWINGSKTSKKGDVKTRDNSNGYTFRLTPTAEINKNWKIKTRIDAYGDLTKDTATTLSLKRVWAEGKYGNATYRFGRMPVGIDMEIMFDTQFSGAQVEFGNKALTTTLNAGRFNLTSGNQYYRYGIEQAKDAGVTDTAANYQAIGLKGWLGKLNYGTAYHHLNSDVFEHMLGYGTGNDDMNTWTAKGTYHFDKNIALQGNYGHNFGADDYNNSWSAVIGYKQFENFNATNAGQWGASIAYRNIGQNVGPTPTYTSDAGTKGLALSFLMNIMPHTYTWLQYAQGKTLIGNENYKELFGRVEWQF